MPRPSKEMVAALVLLALSVACSGSSTPPLPPKPDSVDGLLDRVVSAAAVVVTPDRYWGGVPGKGVWSFTGSANLLCYVTAPIEKDLAVELGPSAASAGVHLQASWDGRPLGEPVELGPKVELRVPPAGLGPGRHVLGLQRLRRLDDEQHRKVPNVQIVGLTIGLGTAKHPLRPRDIGRFTYVSSFLSFGLTGAGIRRTEGCLFVGPAETTCELDLSAPGRVMFEVQNASKELATFELESGGAQARAEVQPMQRTALELALQPGRQTLSLSVKGSNRGLFLWGAPRLRLGRQLPGPIVLITLDTTRRDALSPYGAPGDVTPNLAAIAEHATVFENAHATAPWTLPSHASMFTGLYPSQHGAGVRFDRLRREYRTVAEVLRDRGYLTAGFAGGGYCTTGRGVGQGFLFYRDTEGHHTPGDHLTDAAIDLLDRFRDEPLFLFVNYFDAHSPYRAPDEFEQRFGVPERRAALAKVPIWGAVARGDSDAWLKLIWSKRGHPPVTAAARAYLRAAYLAEVSFMDAQIGRLMDHLSELGLYDDATIVLVSDHGEFLGERGYVSHSTRLDPELCSVPLIVKAPHQQQGGRVTELCSHVDVFGTLLRAAGVEVSGSQGLWLDPTGAALAKRSVVFMEEHGTFFHALMTRMKIAPHLFGEQELDRQRVVWNGGISGLERRDGVWHRMKKLPDWKQRMTVVRSWAKLIPGPERAGAEVEANHLSAADERSLRSLGYVK